MSTPILELEMAKSKKPELIIMIGKKPPMKQIKKGKAPSKKKGC
jgi:hypothetical protein